MSLGSVAAWAGYEPLLVQALPAAAQRRLAAVGVATPLGAAVVGLGARQWLLDAGAGTPGALLAGLLAALLAVATTRLLVAGGGLPARSHPTARYRPAWLAPLWQLATAAIWTLPLGAHAAVELHVEPAAWPRGVAGWLLAATEAPSAPAWVLGFAALGATPALLALVSGRARRDHAIARAARDHALVSAAHLHHRDALEATLAALALPSFAGLPPEAFEDAPFDSVPRLRPWQQAQPAEVSHVRWLLQAGSGGDAPRRR